MRGAGPSGSTSGFTLVEMLIVLAIVGIMSAVAVLGVGGAGRDAGIEAEANRLAASIQQAADQALVADTPLALAWDDKGYAIVDATRDTQGAPSSGQAAADVGDRHDLPSTLRLTGPDAPTQLIIGQNVSVALTLHGSGSAWDVRFDGLNATAKPVRG